MLEATTTTLQAVQRPVRDRLRLVEEALAEMAPAGLEAIDEVGEYLLSLRGKLFRPTLLLLSNEVGGRPSEDAVRLGAIVELLHLATLVHDDSVDHSVRRRGMPTVNTRWTHQIAVIMGDYLYSRAVIEITEVGRLEAIGLLARAANRMTVGEMRQLMTHDALDASREDYFRLCECKTASLMSASCALGAMFGVPEHREALSRFGYRLGMAFQITDDLLDYASSASITGKPGGQDLREHKVTLPLIATLPRLGRGDRRRVERLFDDPEPSDERVLEVIGIVEEAGGLETAKDAARAFADRARESLAGLPRDGGVAGLSAAVDYVVERDR